MWDGGASALREKTETYEFFESKDSRIFDTRDVAVTPPQSQPY
jgi:hypothetical protein